MSGSAEEQTELPAHFTQPVRIRDLAPGRSPRLDGIDEAHARRLAEVYDSLPPVLVQRPTMRVIDGMHRLRAAEILGHEVLRAQFFDGADEEAFIQSVARNIAHGLPLSTADRKAAADRILRSFPAMSDRSIGIYTGLDAKTVAGVRHRSTVDSPQLNMRVGRDGKAHPLDRTTERRQAAELISLRPGLTLRMVAQRTGLSLGTAHDVRQRLLRGEDPAPQPGPRSAARPAARDTAARDTEGPRPAAPVRRAPSGGGRTVTTRDALDILRSLAGDPALRQTDSGRDFVRWLHAHFLTDEAWRRQTPAIPAHSRQAIADVAMKCSDSWRRFANEMNTGR
ncbi:ParB/RepB/Spo0J family partition protein (plasmid) [Streptomyces sp. NBC_00441]|uniref:ParB/RepB/Spo0J family partition protein n=1 Tax=Streptomyces sp. NBC_00441 TaxID=2975742 RepID=UPI002E282F6D|nr:ParB/RepB/Spo0J family partition protein [Streptomyces sp. NBC_00441]